MYAKKKILFFSHAVTLAHCARPLKWLEYLDLERYDVYFATRANLKHLVPTERVTFIETKCIDPDQFTQIVNNGNPIYSEKVFSEHVEEDIDLIDTIKPDVIIGDFRHSLSVSCRIKKIKYINITNACWSPNTAITPPMPEAPSIRFLGEGIYNFFVAPFISIILKINFRSMATLLNKPMSRAGLKFSDYRDIITDGDVVLFCDTPQMIPLKQKRANELFIGPVIWSMNLPLPSWWHQLTSSRKKVLISLGSSGQAELIPQLIKALAVLDIDLIISLSGKPMAIKTSPNIYVVDFLPIETVMKDISLVICNGGSPMTYAALKEGVPVIGIVCNNDQVLNMAHVQQRGAGVLLRFWNLSDKSIKNHVQNLLEDESYKSAAIAVQKEIQKFNLKDEFDRILVENT